MLWQKIGIEGNSKRMKVQKHGWETIMLFVNKHREIIVAGCVFLAGILLRIVCLGEIPGGYHRDEAYGAWNALSLYKDGIDSAGYSYPVYFEAWAHGQNALNSYLMLPLIFLNGGHVSPIVVRLPQVMLAILTLAATYFMMKRMFSYKVALCALFLLSICPWHVMMSRWGLESNLAPGFLMLGLWYWIKGLDEPKKMPLSAVCYGLSLYCYATIWPIVPVMVLLQIIYSFWMGKLKWDKWFAAFCVVLVLLGTPLVLFLLVNIGWIPNLKIACFSIYKMTSFRSGELATSLSQIISNIYNFARLLWKQDVGRPYDVIMPYGFFYNIGRVFIFVGVFVVITRTVKAILRKKFVFEVFLFIQLVGAGIVACLVTVSMTQVNCVYIPLVLCEAIGVCFAMEILGGVLKQWLSETGAKRVSRIVMCFMIGIYLINVCGFQVAYYTDYRELSSAHFQEGADDAVRYAQNCAKERHCSVYVNAGLKYPNVLLATETGAQEYLDTLVYSEAKPAPERFDCDGVTFYMGFDLEKIDSNQVYVLYFTETDSFDGFSLEKFYDWYVAVPCN